MVARTLPLHVGNIPLGADVELRIQALVGPAEAELPVIDVRLYRRSPADISDIAFSPTAAGLRVPMHLAGLVADAIRAVSAAAEQATPREPEACGPR